MSSTEEATACIEKLNGVELHGRQMRVDYSTTQKPHDPTPGAYMGHKRPGTCILFLPSHNPANIMRGHAEREGGGYSRPRYDDREDRRRDHHHDRRDYDDRRGGYGGRDERYDSYYDRYDDRDRYYYDDRRWGD
jgi:transformer-2 protein